MCNPLFISFFGGSVPDGTLQTASALSTTLQVVKDNLGNSSGLQLSTNSIVLGTNTTNNYLTLKDYYVGGYYGIFQRANTSTNFAFLFSTGGDELYIQAQTTVNFWRNGVIAGLYNSQGWLVSAGTSAASQNGAFTIRGTGGNIQSWRSSANVEQGTISNTGVLDVQSYSVAGAVGATGSFVSADAKTVTVTRGIITNIT